MGKGRNTLSDQSIEVLRQVVQRTLNTRPSGVPNAAIEGEDWTYAEITAETGGGVYEATEKYWDGAAWQDTTDGLSFGTGDVKGIREINGTEDIPIGTIIAVLGRRDPDEDYPDWLFAYAAPASAAYDGPWAVSQDPANANKVIVGANRASTRPDLCIVHPSNVFSKTSASSAVTVTANGVIYVTVTREGTVAVSNPAFATTLPAQTDTTIAWPLAYVTFASSAVTGIWQAQYGQIVTYETVECECAEP